MYSEYLFFKTATRYAPHFVLSIIVTLRNQLENDCGTCTNLQHSFVIDLLHSKYERYSRPSAVIQRDTRSSSFQWQREAFPHGMARPIQLYFEVLASEMVMVVASRHIHTHLVASDTHVLIKGGSHSFFHSFVLATT